MLKNKFFLLLILSICFSGCNDTDDTNDDVAENITYQIDNEPVVVITDGIDAYKDGGTFFITTEIAQPEGFALWFGPESPHGIQAIFGPGITMNPAMLNIFQFDVSQYGLPGEYVDVVFSMDFIGTDFNTIHHITGTAHVLRDN